MLTQPVVAEDGIENLMRKHLPSLLVGFHPFLQNGCLDSPHRFSFRNAGVRDPIQVLVKQSLFVFAL